MGTLQEDIAAAERPLCARAAAAIYWRHADDSLRHAGPASQKTHPAFALLLARVREDCRPGDAWYAHDVEHGLSYEVGLYGRTHTADGVSIRKPYNDRAGYVCSKRSGKASGWVVVYDTKKAGADLVQPWMTTCETHLESALSSNQRAARDAMKNPSQWCSGCRGEE